MFTLDCTRWNKHSLEPTDTAGRPKSRRCFPMRGGRKTQEFKPPNPRIPSQRSRQVFILPKVAQRPPEWGMSHGAEVQHSHSFRGHTSTHAWRPHSCVGRPSQLPLLSSSPGSRTGRRDGGGSLARLGGDTMAICGVVSARFRKKEQVNWKRQRRNTHAAKWNVTLTNDWLLKMRNCSVNDEPADSIKTLLGEGKEGKVFGPNKQFFTQHEPLGCFKTYVIQTWDKVVTLVQCSSLRRTELKSRWRCLVSGFCS